MDKQKQDFLTAAKGSFRIWCCEVADTGKYNLRNFVAKAMEKIKEAYDAGYRAAQETTKEEEKNSKIPGVIMVTDDLKKIFPELKNISMIQMQPVSGKTWPEAMNYAKNLKLGGFTDWRLPTCSGDEDDETANNELRGIWRASKALGILVDYRWYWSGTEYSASCAWCVTFGSGGSVLSLGMLSTNYVRCVR